MKIGLLNSFKVLKLLYKRVHNVNLTKKPPWNILFFGADEFSIFSLKALHNEYITGTAVKNLEIVTTIKGKPNPVRIYAEKNKLSLHPWSVEVPNNDFDVGIVVSFGHLIPESIIKKFPLGMLNVHASLLPKWRGAAPIIYSLANGDTETGITIMRIQPKHFDIGEILMQASVPVSNFERMPQLYEKLGTLGANSLVNCLNNLLEKLDNAKPQPSEGVTFAPKVTTEFAKISWAKMTSTQIYNRERALTGLFPLTTIWNGVQVKLVGVTDCGGNCDLTITDTESALLKPGFMKYDKKLKTVKVLCANRTWISVNKIGVLGKKIMSAEDFNNGYIKKVQIENRCFK